MLLSDSQTFLHKLDKKLRTAAPNLIKIDRLRVEIDALVAQIEGGEA